ncbi:activin types I and II receptor domain-containing protein [Ditylenchus destructor]|nr:activin types I and II receptor domain-containing protein [Ditylenchus destructor]
MLRLNLSAFIVFCALLGSAIFIVVSGLECYTGHSVIRGQSVGTATEVCKKDTDQCYKASAEASPMAKLKIAGCSTVRCMASPNKCSTQSFAGQQLELCCCSTDLCNAKQNKTLAGGLMDQFRKGLGSFGGR